MFGLLLYIINSHGTPPTMCRIISSKNKKSTKKQDIAVYKRFKVSRVHVIQWIYVFQVFLVFKYFIKSPLRSVLLEVYVYNVVREIHGIVFVTVFDVLR